MIIFAIVPAPRGHTLWVRHLSAKDATMTAKLANNMVSASRAMQPLILEPLTTLLIGVTASKGFMITLRRYVFPAPTIVHNVLRLMLALPAISVMNSQESFASASVELAFIVIKTLPV